MLETLLLEKTVVVIALGIGAQWLAWRIKMPAIVLLCVFGILAGPVFNVVNPEEDFGNLVTVLIKLSVAVILFEGGLNLRLHELKEAGKGVRGMVLIGLPIALVLGAVAGRHIAGLSVPVALVLSAILVVTGPTVIMPLLRQYRLSPKVASLLKWEGIVNDPIGALLAVLVFEFFIATGESSVSAPMDVMLGLGSALVLSAALGMGAGYLIKWSFNNGLVPEYLKVPVTLCLIFVIYGAANLVQEEAGLLAVTLFGFIVGNIGLRIIGELRRFKEYITVFLVSAVFIILTAGLKPEMMTELSLRNFLFFLTLIFVVRPAAIWLATFGADMTLKERLLLGWIAPRGVVAATMAGLFAPRLIEAGYEGANLLVPMVFAMVFLTVVLHGFSLGWISKALGLASKNREGVLIVGASSWSTEFAMQLKALGVPVLMVDNSWHRLKDARLKSVPVFYGEVLSDDSEENLDLSEMGYLLATSDNDAYNALVCNSFAGHFGRDRIFQLPMHQRSQEENKSLSGTNRGRIAFGEDLRYEKLLGQYYQGWRFQKTTLTKEFNFKSFIDRFGVNGEPIMILQKKGNLILNPTRKEIDPDAGDVLVSYIAPETA